MFDSESVAKTRAELLNLQHVDILYVFGVGLGYFYDALLQWLHNNEGRKIVFIEPDPVVIQQLLQTQRGKKIQSDPQAMLYSLDEAYEDDALFHRIASLSIFAEFEFSALPFYETIYPFAVTMLKYRINFERRLEQGIAHEFLHFAKGFFANFYSNLLFLPFSQRGNALFGKFKGCPAIVCGAGPSLEKNIEQLHELRDKALIIAGGTAMNALNSRGILPHFGAGIDPNRIQYTRLISNTAYEVPFFYRNRMYYKAFRLIHGDRLYIPGSGASPVSEFVEKKLGIYEEPLEEGFNVVNFSLNIARALGCNPIIMVGVDLAYTSEKSYLPGILGHPAHDKKQWFITKEEKDELISRPDIYGNPVPTLWKWQNESFWFGQFARSHPDIVMINSTEGGIGFPGVANIPLAEVTEKMLKRCFDFEGLIHAAVENAKMPPTVTVQSITNLIDELKTSLKKCQEYSRHLAEGYAEPNPDTKAIDKWLKSLESEPAYTHILKDFREKYCEHFPPSKIQKRDVSLFIYLHNNIFEHLEMIDYILASVSSEVLSLEEALKTKKLAFQEEIESAPPAIKNECRTINGKLHGLSTTNSFDGKLLSRKQFDNGKAEGRAFYYYLDGTLKSVQNFQAGLADGRQEYYYQTSQIKSIMEYRCGKLDGKVLLYSPTGMLEREYSFCEGKKHGFERLWDRNGLLRIECEWDMDRPTGSSRSWYPNGLLAKETIYSEEFVPESVRKWDIDGTEWNEEKFAKEHDYFEKAVQHTEVMLDALEKLFYQVSTTLPIVSSKLGNPTELRGLSEQLALLKNQMEHLQTLRSKLVEETDREKRSEEEAIWKTLKERRNFAKLLEETTQRMEKDLKSIQTSLQTMLKGPLDTTL